MFGGDNESQPLLRDKSTGAADTGNQLLDVGRGSGSSTGSGTTMRPMMGIGAACESEESESEEECDPNGDVAICESCNKCLPLSKYEMHLSYYCKKQNGECPLCFEQYPMAMMGEHMKYCRVTMQDPNLVTCKYCKVKMLTAELKDHAIAHLLEQKQVERQVVNRTAEIHAFFEEEKLEMSDRKAPMLTQLDLIELPLSKFEVTVKQDDEDVYFKCTICQQDFTDEEPIRTLRCLHMFHPGCIDRWLTTVAGSCVVCKVLQKPQNLSPRAEEQRTNALALMALTDSRQSQSAARPNV